MTTTFQNPNAPKTPAYLYIPKGANLPRIGATETTEDPMVRIKLFDPAGSWTWYLIEANPETGEAFGYVDGFEPELGYIDLNELSAVRGKVLGLWIERDLHWTPKPLSVVRTEVEARHGR